jgi:2-polyprenyl-3-methyl-5-hydroxy-6-metoxy-1,4-benzoquinol methylase
LADGLRDEVRRIWDANAAFWDGHMGAEGNTFHRELVAPAAERLLALSPGERVLEIACGIGLFARRMAELGAEILATDISPAFLERAKARAGEHADQITFRPLDATDRDQLNTLGEDRFDAAVANMALMDMPEVTPLFEALALLLRPGGRFVFTVMHPCFNTDGCTRLAEQSDDGERIVTTYAIKVTRYKGLAPTRGIGIRGQPVPQYYFHRTLSDLLNPAFAAGLVLDGLEEPTFGEPTEGEPALSLRRFREMPMVLAARLRRPNSVL